MMGERRVMQALFYGFSPERHVPDSSLLREIDRFVDLSGLRTHLGPYYSLPTPNSPYKAKGPSRLLIVVVTAIHSRRPRFCNTQFVDCSPPVKAQRQLALQP